MSQSDVTVVDLAFFADARGWLMAGPYLPDIAYVYATCCWPGAVKAWHRHKEHTDRLVCVSGLARVAAARTVSGEPDMGPGSLVTSWVDVREWVIGPLAPKMLVVPPGLWHGFEAVGGEPCVVVNCPDEPWDPGDEERADPDAIPFGWGEARG